jgi:hypothetical protein
VLRVVSFNVHGLYLASRHRAARMAAIAALLRELSPDLAALQEAFIARDRRALLHGLAGSRLGHAAYFPSGFVGSGLLALAAGPIHATDFRRFAHAGRWWRIWDGERTRSPPTAAAAMRTTPSAARRWWSSPTS